MIVKNENHVIRRCLASVLPLITHWVIVDTGSDDGTQAAIPQFMQQHGVPGELFQRPWVNFAHNRSEAMALASSRAQYLLLIDADEYVETDPGFTLSPLTADVYTLDLISGPFAYPKTQLFRADAGWQYTGVVHEHPVLPRSFTQEHLPGIRTIRIPDGARSRDPLTYRRDALLLEEALLTDPENARTMFYLAQSYADAKEPDLAIDRYSKRLAMGGWEEEVWCSKYQIARLRSVKEEPWPTVQQAYLDAFSLRPSRAEPLFRIGAHYQTRQEFALSHLFFSRAMTIPYPDTEVLYVEHEVYRFYLPLEYAVACFYVGEHETAVRTANRLLTASSLVPERRDQVIRNRQYSLDALYPPRANSSEETLANTGVLVNVFCNEAGEDSIAACVRSLRSQDRRVRAVFVAQTDRDATLLQSVLQGTSFQWRSADPGSSWGDRVQRATAEAEDGDLVLLLEATEALPDKRCLSDLVRHFDRYGCMLMYGQFRWSDGALGDVVPLASPADLDVGDGLASHPVLAFRRELLAGDKLEAFATPSTLLRRAGYAGIRFSDRPFTVRPRL